MKKPWMIFLEIMGYFLRARIWSVLSSYLKQSEKDTCGHDD